MPIEELQEEVSSGIRLTDAPELDPSDYLQLAEALQSIPWLEDISSRRPDDLRLFIKVLYEDREPISYVIDVTELNKLTRKTTAEAANEQPALSQALLVRAIRLATAKKLKQLRDTAIPITAFGNAGSNARLMRVFLHRVGTIDDTPVLAHLGTSRTKQKQLGLLKLFTGNAQIHNSDAAF